MSEVELNGHRFLIGKMNVFDQAHIARKVAPIITGMGRGYASALAHTMNGVEVSPAQESEVMFAAFAPVTEILAQMPEEDVNYVLKKCLGVCSMHTGQQWAAMIVQGQLRFEEQTDLGTMLQLVMEVVKETIGPTLRGLIPLLSGGEASPSPSNSPQ